MAGTLSRAYLSLKEATEDQEAVMTISETRSPTEIEAEQGNMLQYLPVKDETLGLQDSNLTLANSQNASGFGNLQDRKKSTSKRLRVRIINHVSKTFQGSCSKARKKVQITSEVNGGR